MRIKKQSNIDMGIIIKNRRKSLGMSQTELAEAIGYKGKSMICRIENGEIDLGQTKLALISEVLQLDPLSLIGLPAAPAPQTIDDRIKEAMEFNGLDASVLTSEVMDEISNYAIFLMKNKKG